MSLLIQIKNIVQEKLEKEDPEYLEIQIIHRDKIQSELLNQDIEIPVTGIYGWDNSVGFEFYFKFGGYSLIHYLRYYSMTGFFGHIPVSHYDNQQQNFEVIKYRHLVEHSDCSGYYIPVDFDKPMWIPSVDFNENDSLISVGSLPRLLTELEELGDFLGLDKDKAKKELKQSDKSGPENFCKIAWYRLYFAVVKAIKNKCSLHFS